MKICYLLWDFTIGGAQIGLLNLLENGLSEQANIVVVGVAPPRGGMAGRIPAGIGVIEVPQGPRIVTFLKFLYLGYIHSRKADILMTSLFPAAIVGRVLKFMTPRLVLVSLEHSTKIKNRFRRYLLRRSAALVDLSLSDCEATLKAVGRIYAGARTRLDKLQLVAVDPAQRQPAPSRIGDPIRLISVGRLVPEKNYPLLFRELAVLEERDFDFELSLIGEGPELSRLQELAARNGIGDRVRFLGTQDSVEGFLARADIYVQTSLWEGQCFTVVEAMAAGLPVVTTAVGGLRDYALDGRNCLHFDPRQVGGLADLVMRLAGDRQLAKELVSGARDTVHRRFSGESQRLDIEAVFETIRDIRRRRGLAL